MSLEHFFDIEKEERPEDCYPVYTTVSPPQKLDPSWNNILEMTDEQFKVFTEDLRLYYLDQWNINQTPVTGNNNDVEQIKDKMKKFNNLDITDEKIYFEQDGKRFLAGWNNWGNVVNHWFPEMINIDMGRGKSVVPSIQAAVFDPKLWFTRTHRILRKDCLNVFKKKPDNPICSGFRSSIRIVSGAQPALQIRLPVAKWIYETAMREIDSDRIIVWDPSMGWAGRLLAFLAASTHPDLIRKKCIYIGTDPNTGIYNRYKMVEKFWKTYIDKECTAEIIPLCIGSEEFHNTKEFKKYKGKGHIAYTSPPYFNRERYSEDEEQSFRKFPQYNLWRDGFLKGTMDNVSEFLADESMFFWNIADIRISAKLTYPLQNDSIKLVEERGFKLDETIYMLMRALAGRDTSKETFDKIIKRGTMNVVEVNGKYQKYEPIYVFRRG